MNFISPIRKIIKENNTKMEHRHTHMQLKYAFAFAIYIKLFY